VHSARALLYNARISYFARNVYNYQNVQYIRIKKIRAQKFILRAKNEDDPKKLWFILNFGLSGLFVTTNFSESHKGGMGGAAPPPYVLFYTLVL